MRSGIVLISHDRRLLERISRTTVWLDRGITRTLDRGFAGVRALARRGAGAGGERAAQARPQDRDGGGLAALWRHRAAQAQPEAARGPARAAQAAEGATRARRARSGWRRLRPTCPAGWSWSRRACSKSFGDRLVVRDFSTRILRGDRVGIVGPNGAGKTTLLNLLTGALAPDSRRGPARHQPRAGDPRPAARNPRSGRRRLAEALTGGTATR